MTNSSTLYNRRLTRTEAGLWFRFEKTRSSKIPDSIVEDFVSAFVGLPNTLLYMASVDGNTVGATAAYLDSAHCALGLISVKTEPSYRDALLTLIVKSSMPFFRSSSITQVDALVSQTSNQNPIPFPVASNLPNWTITALERAGFQAADTLLLCSIRLAKRTAALTVPYHWDEQPDAAGAAKLLRAEGKRNGLDCSQASLALDLAVACHCLKTASRGGRVVAALGFKSYGKEALVTITLSDPENVDITEVGAAITGLATESGAQRLHFSLLGSQQQNLVESMESLCRSPNKPEVMQLMRKVL